LRFWLERGIDGFRLDALDRLLKDPQLRDDPPAQTAPVLPGDPEDAELDHIHSRNAPDIGGALEAIREAVGPATLLIGEVYLPTREVLRYLAALDVVFSFEALFAVGDAADLRAAIAVGLETGHQGWVLSNHDFSRLVTRAGQDNARAVALLLLSLPGPVFLFQGDELGYGDAEPDGPGQDRHGRDGFRVPMHWDDTSTGGFTTGQPWLSAATPLPPSVADQAADPGSFQSLIRNAIGLHADLGEAPAQLIDSAEGTIVLKRGNHLVAVNLSATPQPAPLQATTLKLEARPGDREDLSIIPAHGGWSATVST
jgi:alpha-glucosidase